MQASLNMEDFHLGLIDLTDRRWLDFVDKQSGVNIFHHPAWAGMLGKSYGFRPFVITLMDATGVIHAGLPIIEINRLLRGRRWVSLPFSDHCSPLADAPETLNCLVGSLGTFEHMRGSPKIEIRWQLSDQAALPLTNRYVLHILRLDSNVEKVRGRIHHSHLRNVRIAQQRGVQIRRGADRGSMDTFYNLHLQTRHKQGVPVQPECYFKLLDELILQKGLGFILLAYHGETCLAGAVFLHWKQTLTYKYGASADNGLSLRPNHLIFWNAIQWGCENGYSLLDFGRSDVENTSLRTFKNRWGADATPLYYSHFPVTGGGHSRAHGLSMRVVQSVIRNTPIGICKLGGQIYYRYLA